jgi:hypothetical protein
MTVNAQPGQEGGRVEFKARYENWIGGESVAPTQGQFAGVTPITGKAFTEVAASTAGRVGLALDAAHTAALGRGRTPGAARALASEPHRRPHHCLGAGLWSRNDNVAHRPRRDTQARPVRSNSYHRYPAHAGFC